MYVRPPAYAFLNIIDLTYYLKRHKMLNIFVSPKDDPYPYQDTAPTYAPTILSVNICNVSELY